MNRGLLLGVLIFVAVIGISLVGDQQQAMGGWWHRAANCGGWGGGWLHHGHHGYGGYGYAGYGGCYGGWGGCYGWSGCYGYGGYGGYGGCGGYVSYGGWGGCGGCGGMVYGGSVVTHGAWDGCGGSVIVGGKGGATQKGYVPDASQKDGPVDDQPTPAVPSAPEPNPPAKASAYLNLRVPAEATVVINNHVTSSKGAVRRYVSSGLQPNMEYQFEIRAELVRDGAKIERTKRIRVRGNESADVVFDFDAPQVASVNR